MFIAKLIFVLSVLAAYAAADPLFGFFLGKKIGYLGGLAHGKKLGYGHYGGYHGGYGHGGYGYGGYGGYGYGHGWW